MEKISVAVRFPPPKPTLTPTGASSTSTSGSGGGDLEWLIEDARVSLLHRRAPVPGVSFTFDHVFEGAATNAQIYDALVRPVIRAAVDGFNGTVFAFDQTSSGKTYTMSGSGADPGVIPLAVCDLFDTARQAVDREFCFKLSCMEIYDEDEEINDLFALGRPNLPIRYNSKHEEYVEGLWGIQVESAEQTLDLFKLGKGYRNFGQTNMNVHNTGSHIVFRMIIKSRAKNQMDSGDAIRVSVLNLGVSFGPPKTVAEGVRFKQESLTNLEIVKSSENLKNMNWIFIFEPALGGNAKTPVICTAASEEVFIVKEEEDQLAAIVVKQEEDQLVSVVMKQEDQLAAVVVKQEEDHPARLLGKSVMKPNEAAEQSKKQRGQRLCKPNKKIFGPEWVTK